MVRRLWGILIIVAILTMLILWISGEMANPFSDARQTFANERVAVRFHNYANDQSNEHLSDMAADFVQTNLEETAQAPVVSHESATRNPATRLLNSSVETTRSFSQVTGAENLLEGTIRPLATGDSLVFNASLVNLSTLDTIAIIPSVRCSNQDPMQCIQEMARNIQKFWDAEAEEVIPTPSYPSYKDYMRARRIWHDDEDQAEQLLLESIAKDKSFVEPHFMLLNLYSEVGSRDNDRRARLDSISKNFPELTGRKKNLYEYHLADYRGQNVKAYELFKRELALDPLDLYTNSRAIVLASEYVNRNQEALEIFGMIPVDSLDLDECNYCNNRVAMAIRALVDLGRYEEADDLAQKLPPTSAVNIINRISPVLRQGADEQVVAQLIDGRTAFASGQLEDIGRVYAKVGIEARLVGNDVIASFVADTMFDGARGFYIEALLADGRYDDALSWMGSWVQDFPNHRWVQGYAGLIYAKMGKNAEANRQLVALERIAENRAIFDRGEANYYRACIYAILGDFDSAFRELDTAYFRGCGFIGHFYNNDPFLADLFEDSRWEAVLNPD